LHCIHHRFERLALLADVLRALPVGPQRGVFAELDQLFEPLLLGVEVKDTSADRRPADRGR
jgi:hypothetical protein